MTGVRSWRVFGAWRLCILICILICMLIGGEASAGPPSDQLKGTVDRALKLLEDPALKGEANATQRRTAVRKIANEIFDFGEMARRSLGRHWQGRTEKEREEFVRLFGDLLERSYFSKIELYGGEKILYGAERVEGDLASVLTKVVTKNGTEVPIDYRMLKHGERWMVYDVNIEGVSLISNYRTQFNKIIQTASYDELVKRLRAKQIEAQPEEDTKRGGKPKS